MYYYILIIYTKPFYMKALKIVTISSLLLTFIFFTIGAVFKINSYSGANLLLTIGGFLAALFFMSLMLMLIKKPSRE